MKTNKAPDLSQFRKDLRKSLKKRAENTGITQNMGITHTTFFFPEEFPTRRYYEILRIISPLFSCLLCYRKRISNGITIIGLEEDINNLKKRILKIVNVIEDYVKAKKEDLRNSTPKDEHFSHIVADYKDHITMMIRVDCKWAVTYLWSKRVLLDEKLKVLDTYFKTRLKNQRKVKWLIV